MAKMTEVLEKLLREAGKGGHWQLAGGPSSCRDYCFYLHLLRAISHTDTFQTKGAQIVPETFPEKNQGLANAN